MDEEKKKEASETFFGIVVMAVLYGLYFIGKNYGWLTSGILLFVVLILVAGVAWAFGEADDWVDGVARFIGFLIMMPIVIFILLTVERLLKKLIGFAWS